MISDKKETDEPEIVVDLGMGEYRDFETEFGRKVAVFIVYFSMFVTVFCALTHIALWWVGALSG